MNTDKLKDIFDGYNPQLASDSDFMSRITQSVDIAARIKREMVLQKKRNRKAIISAAIVGFLCGVVFTMLFPSIRAFISDLLTSSRLTDLQITPYADLFSLLAGCLTIGILSFCTYELTYALTPAKMTRE